MFRLLLIIIISLLGCSGPGINILDLRQQKSYQDYLTAFNSCIGKGVIYSKGSLKGKLSFNFKSQRDSTFLEFSDLLGRKAFLVWITNNSITARNLIDNKQYDNDGVADLLPVLKVLEPRELTEIIWGVEPDYKKRFKALHKLGKKNFSIEFKMEDIGKEKQALASISFNDETLNNYIDITIKERKRDLKYINMKKVWRMLKY